MEFKLQLGGRELKIEIRNLAERANADALVSYGDTMVLATCVMSKEDRGGLSFFPLTVDYEEKYYAAGKIKGPRYIKRESRPSDEAICNARLIDRSIRPRFPKYLKRDVQVVLTILSWDEENEPDLVGLLASSICLSISDIPWAGPIAALRIGKSNIARDNKDEEKAKREQISDEANNKFILNPTYKEKEGNGMDLIFVGGKSDGEFLINMIEGSFDEIPEELILKAFDFAKKDLDSLIDFQEEIIKKVGKEKVEIEDKPRDLELEKEIREFLGNNLEKALFQKKERMEEVNRLKTELSYFIEGKYPGEGKAKYAENFFEDEIEKVIHQNAILNGKRPDGRSVDEIREIHVETGLLPRTHGSALFTRGQTKSLSILTLGTPGDQQLLEGMEITGKKRFMHHYNFPAYSVGEIRPMRGPGRRDIGHGMLAEKALFPLIPSFDQFPYTIRIVSEILSSNGSTSMASVSSSSMALMDAGVPVKRPIAGIALGLMIEQGVPVDKANYKILTDIQGPEDFHGDMDFKVAGTKNGITVLQMDVKIDGITKKILKESLEQGKKARAQILGVMEKTLARPREKLSPFAPRIFTIQINPEKIGDVVGPRGKTINEIIADTEVIIDIQPTGLIFVTSEPGFEENAERAIAAIKSITREIKVGEVFQGKVKKVVNFGAFVELVPKQEGLIHISQLSIPRGKNLEELIKIGDILQVEVVGIDEKGRINLSLPK
ncbi:polyribonucleotide nucleotidyltransferase [Patescibacteria group bacterium]|nr:polyribonucleotide nucleotidyltransferase [Patescibacteria group bacterium]